MRIMLCHGCDTCTNLKKKTTVGEQLYVRASEKHCSKQILPVLSPLLHAQSSQYNFMHMKNERTHNFLHVALVPREKK